MTLIKHHDFPQWNFSLYFVGYIPPGREAEMPADPEQRNMFANSLPGLIELTYNHGSEAADGPVYNTGNSDSTGTGDGTKVKGGFGHIGLTVPDVYATCERLHKMGYEFQKSPNGGGMKGLAFVKDPDGYWCEIIAQTQGPDGRSPKQAIDMLGVPLEGGAGYTGGGGGAASLSKKTTAAPAAKKLPTPSAATLAALAVGAAVGFVVAKRM
jgi:lactoylglutathione lyase